eukprot:COSAG02_NODE_3178_length_7221_cov_1.761163_6_plen_37_part_00
MHSLTKISGVRTEISLVEIHESLPYCNLASIGEEQS